MDWDQQSAHTEYADTSDKRCSSCRMRGIDRSENSASLLCAECHDKYMRLSIPVWVRCFLVVILVVTVAMASQVPQTIGLIQTYHAAVRDKNEKQYLPALTGYLSVLETHGGKASIIMDAIDAAMGAQHFQTAVYIFDTYLVGQSVSGAQYDHAEDIINFLDQYFNTRELVDEAMTECSENVEALKGALLTIAKGEDIDRTYVYFLLANLSEDYQEQLAYYQLCLEQDDRCTYPLAYYGNVLRRYGDYDAAHEAYAAALARNASDVYALRGEGILQLLKGDLPGGLRTIRDAYDVNPHEQYMADAMIIALCANGLRDEAIRLMEERTAEGDSFDQDLFNFLDGKMTLFEYYCQSTQEEV